MTSTRIGTTALALLTAAVAVGGCSSGASTPAAPSPRTVVVTQTATTPATDTPTTPTATSPTTPASQGGAAPAALRPCAATDLRGSLAPDPGGASAGSDHLVLGLTDAGATPCTLTGYPGVSFVGNGTGTQLGAAARRDGSTPTTVTLRPGDSAHAAVTVAQAGNVPDCAPQAADGLRVYPPDDRASLVVRATGLTACRSDVPLLTVGPLH